ncbi:MAG: GNAT family N-acetyltransferase [Gemmatimonadaceae bacterium]
MHMPATIREYRPEDAATLRECIIELQDFERQIDERLRPGASIAAPFLDHILVECREYAGTILVAESDGAIVGFATVLTRVPYRDLDDPPGEHAQVSDLMVRETARRRGVGEALMQEAERRAKAAGAPELRVTTLSDNHAAIRLYQRTGCAPYLTTLTKLL